MEDNKYCQSCSMPMDNTADRGTEKDGTPSQEYCTYCYQNGAFINSDMTIDGMRSIVKTQMEQRNIPTDIIDTAVNLLPYLKRWKTN
jgi:hypothetical protein